VKKLQSKADANNLEKAIDAWIRRPGHSRHEFMNGSERQLRSLATRRQSQWRSSGPAGRLKIANHRSIN
jgi:hypothetical protein